MPSRYDLGRRFNSGRLHYVRSPGKHDRMSDVATVAAVTGGASVLTSGVTALVTWQVSRNSSTVELAKIEAENARLRAGHREEERRNRQTVYHQFIDVINLVYHMLGVSTSREHREKPIADFNHLASGVMIFGPPEVRDGAIEVSNVYNEIWPALNLERMDHPEKPEENQWRDATLPLVAPFFEASGRLMHLMHGDVTRGIVDDVG